MIADVETTHRLTQQLFKEARLLDEGRFEEWLEMLTDDLAYVAPIQQDLAPDWSAASPHQLTYLTESADTLKLRVAKIRTGLQQTEMPRSRTVRLVNNVQVSDAGEPDHYHVHSAFLIYRNHRQKDVEILAGHRVDVWCELEDQLQLKNREIYFAANVLPTKSLSLFY